MALPGKRVDLRKEIKVEGADAPLRSLNSAYEDTIDGIMPRMHIEVVKQGGVPSKSGLIHDSSRTMTCAECDVSYHLYYDREGEMRSTLSSILAAEIINARHPNHEQRFALELPVKRGTATQKKTSRDAFGRTG